jgi:hypothetical protein
MSLSQAANTENYTWIQTATLCGAWMMLLLLLLVGSVQAPLVELAGACEPVPFLDLAKDLALYELR